MTWIYIRAKRWSFQNQSCTSYIQGNGKHAHQRLRFIKMEVFRASGAGGQHINKTSSAVRLIHIPTGMVAECQTERSQVQNREYAMRLLKSRLYEIEKEKQDAELTNARRSQVGSGDRSEKIRTYNFPQGRITDHRIGMSIYQMEDFLNGNLDGMIDALITADTAEKLKGQNE